MSPIINGWLKTWMPALVAGASALAGSIVLTQVNETRIDTLERQMIRLESAVDLNRGIIERVDSNDRLSSQADASLDDRLRSLERRVERMADAFHWEHGAERPKLPNESRLEQLPKWSPIQPQIGDTGG